MDGNKLVREISGLVLVFAGIFLVLGVFTFSPEDPALNNAVSPPETVHNLMGLAGAYCSGFLVHMFGVGAFFIPFVSAYSGLSWFVRRFTLPWWRWFGIWLLVFAAMLWAGHPWVSPWLSGMDIHGGGFIGGQASGLAVAWLRPAGSFLAFLLVTVVGLQLSLGVSWAQFGSGCLAVVVFLGGAVWLGLRAAWRGAVGWIARRRQASMDRREKSAAKATTESRASAKKAPKEKPEPSGSGLELPDLFGAGDSSESKPKSTDKAEKNGASKSASGSSSKSAAGSTPGSGARTGAKKSASGASDLPALDYLAPVSDRESVVSDKDVKAKSESLSACLADFNIQGEIQSARPGPVVTMFEFKPAPGVKVSRIAGLSDDMALALKALAVRVEAPIPGRDTVGVEIPNAKRATVHLRSIIESDAFTKSKSPLTLALGTDIHGTPQAADLAAMPHLLVAGATGAGKSVCLNTILLSLLFKAGPDKVKLLLVDPKRIELSVYADLPHLVHPVVTEMTMAKSALEWAVYEMDRRYEAMARLGVRNISGYNEKLLAMGTKRPEELADLEDMPFLVIIIDELADLMMTAGKEAEMSIVRLAQLARACGIHIILATQRPSVDVVTGLIKANFPTRISFQVTSKHDSRTILDTVGAEKLLGKGDMLYKPGGSVMRRMHGAFVSEGEIAQVVDFWKKQCPQDFQLDLSGWKTEGGGGENGGGFNESDDPLFNEAVEFVMDQGKASISLIQRRFRIGFNKAARYIEQMERDGILGPQDGSKPREVLKRD